MSPTRDERRQAVLGQLATHTDRIQWAGPDSPNNYADAVLELADHLRRIADNDIPARPANVMPDAARRRLIDDTKRVLAEQRRARETEMKEPER